MIADHKFIARHTIAEDEPLLEALRQLNSLPGGKMTLFVTADNGTMCGTLTDGDIRRALIGGASTSTPAGAVCLRHFRSVAKDNIDPDTLRKYRDEGIMLVPVLDRDNTIADIIDLTRFKTILPLQAVLMAGGKGERLRPATLTTPKPLLKIEGKAIIDYNVEALASCGIDNICVMTRYLSEQIEEHFSKPVAGVNVKCVREDAPLGTIGAVSMLDIEPIGNTLVMNSDLLTTISFEEMFLTHLQRSADVTIAVVPYQVSVPYAILTLDNADSNKVTAIEEKPSYSYYANAGIYIFSNALLRMLDGERCDATDLVSKAIDMGKKVTYYPIKGTWIDVGTPLDFRQAGELMRHHNSLALSDPNT